MKVTFLAGDLDAAGHYRCYFPAHYLNQRGHTVEECPHDDLKGSSKYVHDIRAYDISRLPAGLDMILLHQTLETQWAAIQVKQKGKVVPVAYDCDDGLWAVPHWHEAYKALRGKNTRVTPDTLPHIIRRCSLVTCSTPYIADYLSKYNKNVRVIRNRLYWPMWENAPQSYETDRGGEIRIGWIGALDWRKGDLDSLRGTLEIILRKYPQVMFYASGTDGEQTHDYLRIPKDRRVTVDYRGFRHHHMTLHEMLDFDIGLIPLKMIDFNEAKSHLKGMDYNARGIPFVASPTESYKHYVEDGVNGFLARKPRQWVARLSELIEDERMRRDMGRAGRAIAEGHKMEDRIGEWEEAWSSGL